MSEARVLAVGIEQVGMMRAPGLWALARRSPCGARELLCGGRAVHSAALEAPRSEFWNRAVAQGADEFLLAPGRPDPAVVRDPSVPLRDAA